MGEGWVGECSGRWNMRGCFQGWKTVCFLAMTLTNLESCDMLFPFQFFQAFGSIKTKSQVLMPNTCDPHGPQSDCFLQATVTIKNSVALL